MKTYVIADIHGRLDLLNAALAMIGPGTVIFTGDYVDRGPESAGVVARLIAGPARSDHAWIFLKGNHEDMMDAALTNSDDAGLWLINGGKQTLDSYGIGSMDYSAVIMGGHHAWIKTLPTAHEDAQRIYVHAQMSDNEDVRLWGRSTADVGWNGKHVVHGHTAHREPELLVNRTNLDCGAYHFGRLAIGVFDDDLAGGPVDVLWAEACADQVEPA